MNIPQAKMSSNTLSKENESAPKLPDEEPPAYRSPSTASTLPSYTTSTTQPTTSNQTPHRPSQTPAERVALLQEFKESQEHINDNWGGIKGSVEGPPKDPFKVFRWAARKLSHDEDPGKRPEGSKERWYDRSRSEVAYAEDGEVAEGDVDGRKVM